MSLEDRYTVQEGPGGGKYLICKRCGSMQWVHESQVAHYQVPPCACDGKNYIKDLVRRRQGQDEKPS